MKRIILIALLFLVFLPGIRADIVYAPIILSLPDIIIGDMEDNPTSGVPDINFFRFSDAFNFDRYVAKDPYDEDQSTTNVRWSFMAENECLILINGIESLTSPSEALKPELVGKELTNFPNNDPKGTEGRPGSWASFSDLVDSPPGYGPPWDDPTDETALNTVITIYCSNGMKVDSKEIIVKACDGCWEWICDPLLWTEKIFPSDESGAEWIKSIALPDGMQIPNPGGAPFYVASHITGMNKLGISAHATRNVWGSWESPSDWILYIVDSIYRIQYTISSDQTDVNKVPNCRLLTDFVGPGALAFTGGNRVGKGLFPPDADGNIYNVYVAPPDLTLAGVTNLKVKFELIDFNTSEMGANYLEEVEVGRFSIPDKIYGTLVKTYTSWSGWMPFTLGSPFGSATLSTDGTGLYIQTPATVSAPVSGQIDYGQWTLGASDSSESFEANRLYRCVYTLKKANNSDPVGKIRLINANLAGDWIAKIALIPDQTQIHMPTIFGVEYSNWFETMPFLYADPQKNRMSYLFDVSDGQDSQYGRVYLTKVELYKYDIPSILGCP